MCQKPDHQGGPLARVALTDGRASDTCSMEKIKPYQLGRIVVRAPTWVGDAVMSVPSLRRLRQLLPGAHITVAATAGAAGIFTEADFINDILILESGFGPVVRQLRRGKFDLALLFQ